MESVSVNKFRENLKSFVEAVVKNRDSLKVTRRNGEDFVVLSAEDWEREQETLFVLQNSELMTQIAESLQSHKKNSGYTPKEKDMDEILSF